MDITNKDILTVNEFAFYINAHPNTVRRMIKIGILCSFRAGHGKTSPYRIAKSEALRLPLMNFKLHKTFNKEEK